MTDLLSRAKANLRKSALHGTANTADTIPETAVQHTAGTADRNLIAVSAGSKWDAYANRNLSGASNRTFHGIPPVRLLKSEDTITAELGKYNNNNNLGRSIDSRARVCSMDIFSYAPGW